MKHQQVKFDCMEELDKIRIENPELNEAFARLSGDFDQRLQFYDAEVRLGNLKVVEKLKKKCVHEYIKCMSDFKEAYVDIETLKLTHEKAMNIAVDKFNSLMPIDLESSADRENLDNELKALFSDYLVQNQKRQPKRSPSFKDSLNLLMKQNDGGMCKPKISWHKSPKDLIQATIYVAGLIFFLLTSYVIVLNDYIQNLNIGYTNIFSNLISFFKLLITFMIDFNLDFFSIFVKNIKNFKSKILGST